MANILHTWSTRNTQYGGTANHYQTLKVEEIATDPIANTSTIEWTLTTINPYDNRTATGPVKVKIGGTTVYTFNGWTTASFPCLAGSVSGTTTVGHKVDGTQTIHVTFETRIYSLDTAPVLDYGGDLTLTPINRKGPNVSLVAIATSTSSIQITAKTGTEVSDQWQYLLDDTEPFVIYSTTSGVSASTIIEGLTTGTHTIRARARRAYNRVYGLSPTVTIDLFAPTVTVAVSDIGVQSFRINATSSENADSWEYSLNNGTTWTVYSTTVGTNASVVIDSLAYDTFYTLLVRAKKTSNGLYGYTTPEPVTTRGKTLLNAVSALAIDAASSVVNLNWTIFASRFTHTLTIQHESTVLATITGLTGDAGTNNKSIPLTAAQRTAILQYMTAVQTLSVSYTLTTYDGATLVGTAAPITASIVTSAANSAPVFTTIAYADTNPSTIAITGSSDVLVQNASLLEITYTAATARNGSTISKYRAVLGGKSAEATGTTISFGTIPAAENLILSVTAIDSRGYETTVTRDVYVIPYNGISIRNYEAHRINNVDSLITLSFSGSISPVEIEGDPKNSFSSAKYRFKKVSDSTWGAYTTLSGVISTTISFSYDSPGLVNLDSEFEYNVEVLVEDLLTSSSVTLYIPKGRPLVSFRSERVGINTNSPQEALDVNGNIRMNGHRVMGFVRELTSIDDLDDVTESGWYYATATETSGLHYPSGDPGIMEVITAGPAFIVQRMTTATAMYLRVYTTTWSAWKTIIS